MKNNSGITLMSLVVYIAVMFIVIGIMASITNNFYKNTDSITAETEELIEFNKFNIHFLKEIKSKGNKVDTIQENYILFSSGNSFSVIENKIYYNNIEVCEGVQEITFKLGKDGNGQDNNIIFVNVSFDSFNKTMNYKIEEIY